MASTRTQRGLATERLEVKVVEASLVQPLEPRESHDYFLSSADEGFATIVVKTVFFFEASAERHNDNPATVLKEALKKVLVHYYPLAGRLGVCPQGKLIIECNGEGVAFAEANANITIAKLYNLAVPDRTAFPDVTTLSLLTYLFPDVDRPPLATMQVTKFKCGGFTVGVVFQHCVFDGVASVGFACAWGEMARGLSLSTPPFLDRSILKPRSPLCVNFPHTEYLELEELSSFSAADDDDEIVSRSFYFAPASLAKLKKKALQDGILSKCSTFEVLTALLWRTRTEAMCMRPQQKVKLLIVADARSSFEPSLPKGYIGNGLLLTYALATVSELKEKPLSHAVKHVQNAMALLTAEYMQSQIDYREREKVAMLPLTASFLITSWSRLPYNSMDFGWGTPKYATPISVFMENLAIFMPGDGRKGTYVILDLPLRVMERFDKLLHPHLHLFPTSKL